MHKEGVGNFVSNGIIQGERRSEKLENIFSKESLKCFFLLLLLFTYLFLLLISI